MKIILLEGITRGKNLFKDRSDANISYPLGIGYIGAYLESHGHDVEILDNNQK